MPGVQQELVTGGRQVVQGEQPALAKAPERSDAELIDAFDALLKKLVLDFSLVQRTAARRVAVQHGAVLAQPGLRSCSMFGTERLAPGARSAAGD